jgi:hypothetical protein
MKHMHPKDDYVAIISACLPSDQGWESGYRRCRQGGVGHLIACLDCVPALGAGREGWGVLPFTPVINARDERQRKFRTGTKSRR